MKIQISDHFDYKRLLSFTIPTIIMMVFTSVFSVIDDGLFVSNFVGKTAFVAINIMAPLVTIMGAIAYMLSTGGNAIVSKTLGENDKERANKYFSMIVFFAILIGIFITIIGYIFLEPFCNMLGAKGEVLENCLIYGKILLPFAMFLILQIVFEGFLVTAGKPKFAMILTIICGITNIINDIIFIVLLKLGISGAVFATLTGAIIGTIVPLLYFIFSKNSNLKLVKTKFNFKVIGKGCFNGLSELITNTSAGLLAIIFNYQLMKVAGNDGVAAYGVIMYLSFIFTAVFYGYSTGVAPIVGYNYGAKNTSELKNIFKKSITITVCIGLILFVLALISAVPLSMIFVSYDKELLNMAVIGFRIYAFGLIAMGINIFASAFFTALNNGLVSGMVAVVRTFVFEIAMVFILPIFFGLYGIWFSPVIAGLITLIFIIFVFKKMNKRYNYY